MKVLPEIKIKVATEIANLYKKMNLNEQKEIQLKLTETLNFELEKRRHQKKMTNYSDPMFVVRLLWG